MGEKKKSFLTQRPCSTHVDEDEDSNASMRGYKANSILACDPKNIGNVMDEGSCSS